MTNFLVGVVIGFWITLILLAVSRMRWVKLPCPACQGRGKEAIWSTDFQTFRYEPCPTCKGQGTIERFM
jgi:hypothetical protein